MANVAQTRNPMPTLQQPAPKEEPLEMKPLDDSHLFDKKKKKVTIKEPEAEPQPAPTTAQPVVKKKKRTISEAHKKKLEEGRKKGLITRRRKAAERKAAKEAAKKEKKLKRAAVKAGLDPNTISINSTAVNAVNDVKEVKTEMKVNPPIQPPPRPQPVVRRAAAAPVNNHAENINIASAIKKQPAFRKAAETKSYNADTEFKKFYSMMSRYEAVRYNQRQRVQKQMAQKTQKNKIHKPRNIQQKWNGIGMQTQQRRRQMNKQTKNNYMNFFS